MAIRGGTKVELITLVENKESRTYNFLEVDKERRICTLKQLENRNGKIFMRTKVRRFQI